MVMRRRRPGTAVRFLLSLALLGAASCMAGPFERENPNDPEKEFTIRIVSTADTLSPSQPRVVLQLITEPVMNGYAANWSVPDNRMLYHAGNGVFAVGDLPVSLQSIVVTAGFQNRTATYTLYVRPTP